jgi:hypothetical protein
MSFPPPVPRAFAAEVLTTIGDTVVGLRRVDAIPASGGVRRAAAVVAVAAFAVAAIALGTAARVAADNDAAAAAWHALGRPAWAFRARLLPPFLDGVTLTAAMIGIIAAVVWLSRRERGAATLRIGPGTCDVPIAAAPGVITVAASDRGVVVDVPAGATAERVGSPVALAGPVHYLLGEVASPGAITFKSTDRLTLLAAIARAGGLSERASSKIRIQRPGADGKMTEITARYKRILSGDEPDPELRDGDVIVVKESFF